MNYLSGGFKAIENLLVFLAVLCIIFVPLGAWKAVELIIWAWKHIDIIVK